MTKKEPSPEGDEKEPYEPPALTQHGTVVAITGTSAAKEKDKDKDKDFETGKEKDKDFETGKEIL